MSRLDKLKQIEKEPKRIEFAKNKLTELGCEILSTDDIKIVFSFKNLKITIYPYSGWFTGKGIKDGRGITDLINQLKQK